MDGWIEGSASYRLGLGIFREMFVSGDGRNARDSRGAFVVDDGKRSNYGRDGGLISRSMEKPPA